MNRVATLQFVDKGNGKVAFLRGRENIKDAPWARSMTVGKARYDRTTGEGEKRTIPLYDLAKCLEHTAHGVRVEIEPVQGTRKVIFEGVPTTNVKVIEPVRKADDDDESDKD